MLPEPAQPDCYPPDLLPLAASPRFVGNGPAEWSDAGLSPRNNAGLHKPSYHLQNKVLTQRDRS